MLIYAQVCLLTFIAAQLPGATYNIQTVAGTNSVGDGGYATAAVLGQAEGIALDARGNVYFADAEDNRVRRISADGIVQTIAGTGVSGFSGDGGPAQQAQLSHPYGIAFDTAGNLYIADLGNACVRKITVDGTITTIAAKLSAPRNVAVGSDGTLYISDFGAHQVFQLSCGGLAGCLGGPLTAIAGAGKPGSAGDGGPALQAQLNSPAGLAVDSAGALYIADSGNNRIRKVYLGSISTVLNVAAPTGVATGPSGTLYIAAKNYLGTLFKSTGGGGARDLSVDASGTVFFSAGQLLEKLTGSGAVATIAGTGASRYYGGDGGPGIAARLHTPTGIVRDNLGYLYLADSGNNRIRRLMPSGVITTIAGTGEAGSQGDGGPAFLGQLQNPRGLALNSAQELFIADSGNNRIRKLTSTGAITTVVDQLNDPEAVAFDANGSLYIADTGNNRILKLTASGLLSTIAAVQNPAALALDAASNLLIAVNTGVVKLSNAGLLVTLVDGLNAPRALALSDNGDLLIVESGGHRIRRINSSGQQIILAGTGIAGFSGDNGPATLSQLNTPSGVAVDPTGILWVADSGNNCIRSLTPSLVAPIETLTVVNGASQQPGPVAPGEIVTIYGSGFDPASLAVSFDGQAATIFFANANQINVLAPFGLTAGPTTAIDITTNGFLAASTTAPLVGAAPGIFTVVGGAGQAAATNDDGRLNSVATPAARGSIITLYATGTGQSLSTLALTIGGASGELLYAGPAPGFPGLAQINARVPANAPTGAAATVLSIGAVKSQDNVTITIQ